MESVLDVHSGADLTKTKGLKPLTSSIAKGGFFDRHPILVPATIFALCWIPYIVIFFRQRIAFGDLGLPYPLDSSVFWVLLAVQLGVCVISHSLTIRTIVRLYAPMWLIWGSIAFYALSPAWGLMTAADIRHPLFAAVFCVFTSSAVFALYSEHAPKWLWAQLAGGALSVCLLRADGWWAILPALACIFIYKGRRWMAFSRAQSSDRLWKHAAEHFSRLQEMQGSARKKEESLWADVCAAFLVLCAVCLLFFFAHLSGWGLPLGEPSYGHADAFQAILTTSAPFGANLTGTDDVAGILPFAAIEDNSVFPALAESAAQAVYNFQCLPLINLTFSWVAYVVLFVGFLLFVLKLAFGRGKRLHDFRPLIIALPMVILLVVMAFTGADQTLRYLMPILAAQPMMFGACFASRREGGQEAVEKSRTQG